MNFQDVCKIAGRPTKKRKRLGRGPGSGNGKTAGRGHKGAGARSGWKSRITNEGGQMPLFRRLPKRGFSNIRFMDVYQPVNVAALDVFEDGATVTRKELVEKSIVRNKLPVKILGTGEVTKKLTVIANKFSASARAKIEAAGGSVQEL